MASVYIALYTATTASSFPHVFSRKQQNISIVCILPENCTKFFFYYFYVLFRIISWHCGMSLAERKEYGCWWDVWVGLVGFFLFKI